MAKSKTKLHVLVLGAGASASCGIALTKDILRESMAQLMAEAPEKAQKIDSLLAYIYEDFRTSYRNYPNVEDFLNILETAATFNSTDFIESIRWSKSGLQEIKRYLLRAIADYIWKFMTGNENLHHIEDFVEKQVWPGTVVITFNWDLTVELTLSKSQRLSRVVHQYSRNTCDDAITLLKPHGSINWIERDELKGLKEAKARKLRGDIYVVDLLDSLISHEFTPKIVPPVANKDFSESSALSICWSSVYKALRDATDVAVLGYSLPKEDQFARFVFRRALRNNVLGAGRREKPPLTMRVVNPDEATEATFARLVSREKVRFEFHRVTFQDYVDVVTL